MVKVKASPVVEEATVCSQCCDVVDSSESLCSGCGSLFDGAEAVKIIITKKDVTNIKAFLDIMLENRVVFKDLMRHIGKIARVHGAKTDSISLEGLVIDR
jgi:hypothetical protein